MRQLRRDFPTLDVEEPPVYLDNACVTLRPRTVIDAIRRYYDEHPSCGGRSLHRYGTKVSMGVARTRHSMARYLGASSDEEVIFTKNATHSINQVAIGLPLERGSVILVSDREHNSNLVPWRMKADREGLDLRVVPSQPDNTFDMETFETMADQAGDRLGLVAMSQVGNLDGVEVPIQDVARIAHDLGALVAVDGAQSVPHQPIDVQHLGIDFLSFSIHKMLGPSGMGCLWGRKDLLDGMTPLMAGGSTVSNASHEDMAWLPPPARFEGGLGHYAGILGTEAALEYLHRMDLEAIHEHEIRLNRIMSEAIIHRSDAEVIGPEAAERRGSICSITTDKVEVQDLAIMLDEGMGIMVRAGRHCVHDWFNRRGVDGSLRASAYMYNTVEEAKLFRDSIDELLEAF